MPKYPTETSGQRCLPGNQHTNTKKTGLACCRGQRTCATSTQDLYLEVDETCIHLNVPEADLQQASSGHAFGHTGGCAAILWIAVIKCFINRNNTARGCLCPPAESVVLTLKFRPRLLACLENLWRCAGESGRSFGLCGYADREFSLAPFDQFQFSQWGVGLWIAAVLEKKKSECVDARRHGWLTECVTVLWVYVQTVHVSAAQIRQERGGKIAPVKHGAGPKATEVVTPTSLSLVETSKGTAQSGEEQSFHSNLFFFFSRSNIKAWKKLNKRELLLIFFRWGMLRVLLVNDQHRC